MRMSESPIASFRISCYLGRRLFTWRTYFNDEEPNQQDTQRNAAETVLAWAKDNNLFRRETTDQAIDIEEGPESVSNKVFSADETLEIFKKKCINLVFFDEANEVVTILTAKKLTRAEEQSLPFRFKNEVTINYSHGGVPQVKSPSTQPHVQPVTEKGGIIACGSSINPVDIVGAGTLGAIVKDKSGAFYGLTNNHVSGGCNYSAPEIPILCPGPLDAKNCAIDPFTIGRHKNLLQFVDGLPENVDISKNSDAAIFALSKPDRVSSYQGLSQDTPKHIGVPMGMMKVTKHGRTTGLTRGKIIGISASPIDVAYSYGNMKKVVYFDDVWLIKKENDKPFSEPGDSGSLVIGTDSTGQKIALGLVFAGNPHFGHTYMLPLNPILTKLGVELVHGHNPFI
uniref:Nal1 C-terminal domain-containing protein n=1 Tax=uncultured marine bacterium Ant24C4 TaxID=360425 RepID=Q2PYC7_9BACT|nr:hypothetical protein [uncultured marine bacterium Ant24C4]